MTRFKIDIVSDTVCPWCYVGAKRLNQAIATYKAQHPDSDDTFETTWLPFYLNPAAPLDGEDKREMYARNFGGEERMKALSERMAAVGKEVGIAFSFGGRTGNTRKSHRLIEFARQKGGAEAQTRVVNALFNAYFEREGDITSDAVLTAAATSAGMEEGEVTAVLASDQYGDVVDREVSHAQQSLVSGVPHFTIQDKFEVSGAQESAAFTRLFERIKQLEGVSMA